MINSRQGMGIRRLGTSYEITNRRRDSELSGQPLCVFFCLNTLRCYVDFAFSVHCQSLSTPPFKLHVVHKKIYAYGLQFKTFASAKAH